MKLPAMRVSMAAWAFWDRTQTSSYTTGLSKNYHVVIFGGFQLLAASKSPYLGIRTQDLWQSKPAALNELNIY